MSYKRKLKEFFNICFAPTSFEPLKFIFFIENIACVYRNIHYYNEKYRLLIYLRVLIDVAIIVSSIVIYSIYLLPTAYIYDIIFYYTNTLNSLIIVLIACYHSKTFNKFCLLIEDNHMCFKSDQKYLSELKKRERLIKTGTVIFNTVIIVSGFISSYYRNKFIGHVSIQVFFTFNSRICDLRNTFEYIALYTILYVISQQVECITREVKNKRSSVAFVGEQRNNISDGPLSEMRQETRDFEELSTVFSNVAQCSKLFNEMYGRQLVCMLATATIYCIMFLYTMTFLSIKGFQDLQRLFGSVFKLLVVFSLLLLLSRGAQTKLNKVRDLRCQLGKLIISNRDYGAEYKATKNFLCLVSTRSIQTKTFGSINVDMSLIPSFIMFVTSYTVIALQFSNIV